MRGDVAFDTRRRLPGAGRVDRGRERLLRLLAEVVLGEQRARRVQVGGGVRVDALAQLGTVEVQAAVRSAFVDLGYPWEGPRG